jgi:trehalose transport system substrate-binding protein
MRRAFPALATALVLAGSACAKKQEAPSATGAALTGTTITFSVSLAEEEKAGIQEVLSRFETNTGAKVSMTSITSADLPQKLKVEVDSNTHTVHLFAQDNLALRALVDQKLVEDLSSEDLPDGIVDSMVPERFEGKQYFLPFRPNVRVAYVNKDRFSKASVQPPKTVDDLKAAAQTLKQEGGGPKVTLSLADGDPAAVTISEWVVSYGGDPLVLNDAGSVKAFEFLQGMWKDGLLAKESLQAKFDTEVDNLRGETAWLAQNWPFTSGQLSKEGVLDRFDVYEGWRGPDRPAHVIGGDVLGIPRGVTGRQKEAALELARYLMSKQAQEILAQRNAWPSIRDDAYGKVPAAQQETFDAIKAALQDGWYRPNVAYWPDVSEAMNDAVRRVIQGAAPAKATLDELHAKIESAAKSKGVRYPPA